MAWPTRTFPTDEFLRRWFQDYVNTLRTAQQHIASINARLQAAEENNARLTAQVQRLTAQARDLIVQRNGDEIADYGRFQELIQGQEEQIIRLLEERDQLIAERDQLREQLRNAGILQ